MTQQSRSPASAIAAGHVDNPTSPEQAAERAARKAALKAAQAAYPKHPDACTVCGVHTNGLVRCAKCGKPYCGASHGRKAAAACCAGES